MFEQTQGSIRAAAQSFDRTLEEDLTQGALGSFAPGCAIRVLGLTLRGQEGAKPWQAGTLGSPKEICFAARVRLVREHVFLEESAVWARLGEGGGVSFLQSEVFVFQANLNQVLRLCFGRLDFTGPTGRAVVGRITGIS